MALAVRQGFDVARDTFHIAVVFVLDIVAGPLPLHRFAVDVQDAAKHLDPVARQADDALDVVRLVVGRPLEDGDVAPFGFGEQDTPWDQGQTERQRMTAVPVGEFRDEQIIADQQRRHHRTRRNVEGFISHRADGKGDENRIDDGLDRFLESL